MKTKSKVIISVIVVIALIAGGFTYLNYSNSNTGKVNVYVEDAPILNVSAVYITFTNVSLHNTSSGWHTYTLKTTTVNILDLTTTNASLLSSFSINAGNYTMIRLYLTSIHVIIGGEVRYRDPGFGIFLECQKDPMLYNRRLIGSDCL